MRADAQLINERLDSFRDALYQSPHANLLVPALDVVTRPQPDERSDSPSALLARYMLFGEHTYILDDQAMHAPAPIVETPEIVFHGIRQSAAILAIMPEILNEEAERDQFLSTLTIPILCRSVAVNDTALVFAPKEHRQAVWHHGPKGNLEAHQSYKAHTAYGFRVAAQNGNMGDPWSRLVAMSIARHHTRLRQGQDYGLRWRRIDGQLRRIGSAGASPSEIEITRRSVNMQRIIDAADDLLTRQQGCETPTAHERASTLLNHYLESVSEIAARRRADIAGLIDPDERRILEKIGMRLVHELGSDTPLAAMYQEVWDQTRQEAEAMAA